MSTTTRVDALGNLSTHRKTAGVDADSKIAVTNSKGRGFPACGRVDSVDPL